MLCGCYTRMSDPPRMLEPMALDHCPGCRRPWKLCSCDRMADAWAEQAGATIPDEDDTGRLKGGHLNDKKRGGKQLQLARLVSDMGGTVQRVDRTIELEASGGHALRHYREWIVARLDAIATAEKNRLAEVRRLTLQRDLIDEVYDGEGKRLGDIAAARGHRKSWAVGQFKRIEADAAGIRQVEALTGRCPCGCGRHVVPNPKGRPRIYATPKCERRAMLRRVRSRRRRDSGKDSGKSAESATARVGAA